MKQVLDRHGSQQTASTGGISSTQKKCPLRYQLIEYIYLVHTDESSYHRTGTPSAFANHSTALMMASKGGAANVKTGLILHA
jgi:hypothetical protein